MSRLDYLKEDNKGYYLDYYLTIGKMEAFSNLTMKFTIDGDVWYSLNYFIRNFRTKKTTSILAKQINKIEDGSAVRIMLHGCRKMWYVNEQGLHIATDLLLSITNDLKITL